MNYQLFLKIRNFRRRLIKPVAEILIKLKIGSNLLTFLSLLFGITAIYFLFVKHYLFVIFILLHFIFDSLDGTVAELTKETRFGQYFDKLSDHFVFFLLLIKSFFHFNDYFILLVLGLFLIKETIYFLSKFTLPGIFEGIPVSIIFIFKLFWVGIILSGVLSLYSLIHQFNYFLTKKRFRLF